MTSAYKTKANTSFEVGESNFVQLNVSKSLIIQDTYSFQGTNAGYLSGGYNPFGVPGVQRQQGIIQKFPFATLAGAIVGTFNTTSRPVPSPSPAGLIIRGAGHSSETNGYMSGGRQIDVPGVSPPASVNNIDKFPFSTPFASATDVGDLSFSVNWATGHSSKSNAYVAGGTVNTPPNIATTRFDIQKFSFATDSNAVSSSSLIRQTQIAAGYSSESSGYVSGGYLNAVTFTNKQKFPFSTDSPAIDTTNLGLSHRYSSGVSSQSHGYALGSSAHTNIQKFPFATDAASVISGITNLSPTARIYAGFSSTTNAYWGTPIHTFPFATDGNSATVGSLASGSYDNSSQQD